ncbi:hypothetical protein ACH0BF_24600 [Pseudobacillus sp. 179-B 2D1 NHS]|uniref:hypothetical protein n=1 Tax=Pseudobacillus sp. 179-B 2D1 NHS TaxID=3374292 RepID=UPI00387A76E7
MKRVVKVLITVPFVFVAICILFLFYVFVGQEYVYAKKYANRLLDFELPEKTEVIEQDFDYGVLYGGGPWGSGGYPTVVVNIRILTKLSEKAIFEHYKSKDFEIYFEGTEELKKNSKNQIWYEGLVKEEDALSTEENNEAPIEVIIQYRTEFSYPFFIDLY